VNTCGSSGSGYHMGWESPGGTTHFAPPAYTHHTHHHYEAAAYSGLVEGSALCSQAGLAMKTHLKNPLEMFVFGFFKIFNFFYEIIQFLLFETDFL
jgi:hypothetical protein